jgi:hypothetical protein
VPEHPEYDTVMVRHGAEAFKSAAMSLMHALRTKDKEAQLDM